MLFLKARSAVIGPGDRDRAPQDQPRGRLRGRARGRGRSPRARTSAARRRARVRRPATRVASPSSPALFPAPRSSAPPSPRLTPRGSRSSGSDARAFVLSSMCRPHSRVSAFSHHQRPERGSSPGFTARVQGAQPTLGYPSACRRFTGTLLSRMYRQTWSAVQSATGLIFQMPPLPSSISILRTSLRVTFWSRRSPVTYASRPARKRRFGSTFRRPQQRRRFSSDS